jgi:hypothetical protein
MNTQSLIFRTPNEAIPKNASVARDTHLLRTRSAYGISENGNRTNSVAGLQTIMGLHDAFIPRIIDWSVRHCSLRVDDG